MPGQDESGQGTATAPSTPSGGMQANAESLVTPELESAFSSVFDGGGEGGEATRDGQTGPTARERQRDTEEAESLASLEGASEEDTRGEQFASGEDEGSGEATEPAESTDRASQDEQAGGEQDGSKGKGQDDSTLSPLLRHAAKRAGWKDEEIDQLHQENPELAERTFQRLHGSYSDLSAQYARLGQAPGQQQPGPSPQAPPNGQQPSQGPAARQSQQQPAQQSALPQGEGEQLLADLYGSDQLSNFKEKYGDDFLQEVVQPLAERVVGPLREMHQHYEQQQQEAVAKEIGNFFEGVPSELGELYGNEKKGLSDEQVNARNELAQLADQIRAGAASQGVDMSVSEALDRATMLHAHQHLEQIERKRLTDQVRKRSSKLTNRPSQRRTTGQTATTGGDRSIAAAQEAYAEKAAELGIDV